MLAKKILPELEGKTENEHDSSTKSLINRYNADKKDSKTKDVKISLLNRVAMVTGSIISAGLGILLVNAAGFVFAPLVAAGLVYGLIYTVQAFTIFNCSKNVSPGRNILISDARKISSSYYLDNKEYPYTPAKTEYGQIFINPVLFSKLPSWMQQIVINHEKRHVVFESKHKTSKITEEVFVSLGEIKDILKLAFNSSRESLKTFKTVRRNISKIIVSSFKALPFMLSFVAADFCENKERFILSDIERSHKNMLNPLMLNKAAVTVSSKFMNETSTLYKKMLQDLAVKGKAGMIPLALTLDKTSIRGKKLFTVDVDIPERGKTLINVKTVVKYVNKTPIAVLYLSPVESITTLDGEQLNTILAQGSEAVLERLSKDEYARGLFFKALYAKNIIYILLSTLFGPAILGKLKSFDTAVFEVKGGHTLLGFKNSNIKGSAFKGIFVADVEDMEFGNVSTYVINDFLSVVSKADFVAGDKGKIERYFPWIINVIENYDSKSFAEHLRKIIKTKYYPALSRKRDFGFTSPKNGAAKNSSSQNVKTKRNTH